MEPIVHTKQGAVRGTFEGDVAVFRGIPYAAPPFGDRRFRPPARAEDWNGVRDASAFGPMAFQNPLPDPFGELFAPHPQGKDCLSLNVWTPDPGSAGLPVLVWFHGGAIVGCGSAPLCNGAAFARDGVVVVTINYRLGAEGFLCVGGEGAGNFGFLDQIAALEWVQDNIGAFGGDAGIVTIAGQSFGGICVSAMLGAPRARGLFRRAIIHSGVAHPSIGAESGQRVAGFVCEKLGVKPSDLEALAASPVDRMLAVEVELFQELQQTRDPSTFREGAASMTPYLPITGTDVIPERPLDAITNGSASGIDVLTGYTTEGFKLFLVMLPNFGPDASIVAVEADAIFTPSGRSATDALDVYRRRCDTELELMVALENDRMWRIPTIRLAEAQQRHNPQTFVYSFSWKSPAFDGRLGAAHLLDIPFVFDTIDRASPLLGDSPPRALAEAMHGAWVSFATSGTPQHSTLPKWPAYEPVHRSTMDFSESCAVVDDPAPEERELWEGVL